MQAPAPVTLLCLPCAGASASPCLAWRRLLPAWIAVRPVELPGRGTRLVESAIEDFDRLADCLQREHADALRGPHALFGHSLGGLLALGLARRSRQAGWPGPRALFVCASAAPSRRDPARLAAVTADDDTLVEELRRQGGTPDEILAHPELRRLTLDTLRADFRVCASFAATRSGEIPLAVPVHAFGGRSDAMVPADLAAWRDETTGPFALDWFDGGHFFIRQHAGAVMAAVARTLAQAAPRGTDSGESHDALASA